MGTTNYPTSADIFNVPSSPGSVNLSDAGDSSRNHAKNHDDLGAAVMALQHNAAQLTHDHSGGGGTFATGKLSQQNTHQNADTDSATSALHHTLGSSPDQAAAGDHGHSYEYLGISQSDPNGWGVWTNIICQSGFWVPPDNQYPPQFPKGVKVRRHVSGIIAITGLWNIIGSPGLGKKIVQLPTDGTGNLGWAPKIGLGHHWVVKAGGASGLCGLFALPDGGIYLDPIGGNPTGYIYVNGLWSAV
jgi:hypothetical protein